mmetsp:Transcript_16367/g.33448  ORF Transcript_16367/g.33448 Transcript_16367/m.33448 type:complete len:90 (-) Transcript_16367:23-292(-)
MVVVLILRTRSGAKDAAFRRNKTTKWMAHIAVARTWSTEKMDFILQTVDDKEIFGFSRDDTSAYVGCTVCTYFQSEVRLRTVSLRTWYR